MKSEGAAAKVKKPRRKKLKRIYSTNTILWRYFAFFASGLILVIAITCYWVLGNTVMSETKKRVRNIGADLIAAMNENHASTATVIRKMSGYSVTEGVEIFLYTEDGKPVYADANLSETFLDSTFVQLENNLNGWEAGSVEEYMSKSGGNNMFNYAACVTFEGMRCKMLISYSVSSVSNAVTQMEIYMLIAFAAALIIAFFVSYSLAKKLSSPLRDISGTAEKLAAGNYDVQFNSLEYTEIAKLSDTLNYMRGEIKKSDDFQKELIANVSHDLKTPLTMIKAYASMIQEISGDDKQKREKHLQVIIDEADRLTGLVNDVLSTSKLRSGIEQLNLKVFNLTELVYSVINKFNYLQETQGYSIMVDITSGLYTSADEEKINQVIYNLVSNAVNYTGEDKTVYVSLTYSPQTDRIRFAVRDTGKGIAEEEISHIWDRYYRSNDTHTRPVKGTGIGLSIVKTILQRHDFNFGVTSKVDEGSVFFIDFPSVSSQPQEE